MENNLHIIRYLKDKKIFSLYKKQLKTLRIAERFEDLTPLQTLAEVDYKHYDGFMFRLKIENNYDIQKIFDMFLKYNKSYTVFYKNLNKKFVENYVNDSFHIEPHLSAMDILKRYYRIGDYIGRAFSWRTTKEGYDFWRGLSNKWHRLSNHIVEEILNKKYFDEPLFKTDDEYTKFIEQYAIFYQWKTTNILSDS